MVLYTIIDEYDIFYNPPSACAVRQAGNVMLEGENTADGFRIRRLISTNPADYLDSGYVLGSYWNKK